MEQGRVKASPRDGMVAIHGQESMMEVVEIEQGEEGRGRGLGSRQSTAVLFREMEESGPKRTSMDHAINVVMGPLPVEVVQLKSWACRNLVRLLLVGSFVGALLYFVLTSVKSQGKTKFISLKRDAGLCKRTLTPTLSGTYTLDESGRWSSDPDYDPTSSVLRVEFNDLATEDYEPALRAAVTEIASLEVRSIMENVFLVLAWKFSFSAGSSRGSAEFSFAADAEAIFDAKTIYIGAVGCPSANYPRDSSSSSGTWGYQDTHSGLRYEYHVDYDAGETEFSWDREALEACVLGRSGIALDELLGTELVGTVVVDSRLILHIDWFSAAVAAAVNGKVVGDPSSFMEELDASLFNFPDDDDDYGNNNNYYYSSSSYDPDQAWSDYLEATMYSGWGDTFPYFYSYASEPYKNESAKFCPAHFPDGFVRSSASPPPSPRFFTDSRVPGMDPLACAHTADSGWVCSVVLGNVHAYPYIQTWLDGCNHCNFTLNNACNYSASESFNPDFVGGFFLKPTADGAFATHPFRDKDAYWRFADTDSRTLSALARTMSWHLQTASPAYISYWNAAVSACALDFETSFFAFNAYERDGNAVSINSDGFTAHPSSWHCKDVWSRRAATALALVSSNSKAPATLFENYFECRPKRLQRWIFALGVGLSNARTLFVLISFFLTAIVLEAIAKYKRSWLAHGVLVTEDDVQDHSLLSAYTHRYRKVSTADLDRVRRGEEEEEEEYDDDEDNLKQQQQQQQRVGAAASRQRDPEEVE